MGLHDTPRDDSGGRSLLPERVAEGSLIEISDLKVSDLTYAEKILLFRRREGLNQTEMAKRLGIHRITYSRLENGETFQKNYPTPHLGDLRSYEKCFIMRRRVGWSQEMCADQMGISRHWFYLMELGRVSPEKLVHYWSENAG